MNEITASGRAVAAKLPCTPEEFPAALPGGDILSEPR
jgi:hypothetical protein